MWLGGLYYIFLQCDKLTDFTCAAYLAPKISKEYNLNYFVAQEILQDIKWVNTFSSSCTVMR